MRYSAVNHWYKVQEVLGGLEGTSAGSVQMELLKHLGSGHIRSFDKDGSKLKVSVEAGDPLVWSFTSPDAVESFVATVCDWCGTQRVSVPAR